jgi:Glycosyltransferase (GlcNAc)
MTAPPTIFILIASYRDSECQWTVRDLFEKAAIPERIRVGICWQADPEQDQHCFEIETRPEQVDMVHFLPGESKGLGWARAQAQTLLRDEDYALQIDSHMRFIANWDERMLALLEQCDSPQPVLTVYPPGYTPPDQLDVDPPPRVQCIKHFNDNGVLFYSARTLPEGVQPAAPMATACLAGGFIFGSASWLREVPHDPDIYFNGEEHALAARLWTHGFDLFSPHETLIYHYYMRTESAKHWTDDPEWAKKHKKSMLRLRQLLTPGTVPERDRQDLEIYCLGNKRPLSDYEAYAGVNFATRSIASYARTFPYVCSSDVSAALLTDHRLAVAEQTQLFIMDDEGLLFSAAQGELYHLNTAATYVWCQLEEGAAWDELTADLSNFCHMPLAEAENALVNLVVHWRSQGVMQCNETDAGQQDLSPSRDELPEDHDEDALAFPAHATIHREQYYSLLDSCFCVQFCEREQVDWLMPALTLFEVAGNQDADCVITIYAEDDKHHIFKDRELMHTNKVISQLASLLTYQVVRTALDHHDHILNLHAGMVAKNGAVIALPAQLSDGRSTLIAGMIKRGYQYLSDNVAPLARDSCKVIPVPLGICIQDTDLPTLQGQYPEIQQQPIQHLENGSSAVYLQPPTAAIAPYDQPRQITHIVFPRHQAGASTSLKPVSQIEAVTRVLAQWVSIPDPLTLEDAGALVHWIEQIQCYELLSGSIDASIDQIDGLLQSEASSGPHENNPN